MYKIVHFYITFFVHSYIIINKNGKNYTKSEAVIMLDNKLEQLGVNYQRQYDLLKGVLTSDKKKYDKMKSSDLTDRDVFEILVSKGIECLFQ